LHYTKWLVEGVDVRCLAHDEKIIKEMKMAYSALGKEAAAGYSQELFGSSFTPEQMTEIFVKLDEYARRPLGEAPVGWW